MMLASRRRSRGIAAAVATVMAVVGLAGCGSGPREDDKGPIVLFTDNTGWKEGFQKVGDAMEKITGRNLKVQSIPVYSNFQQTLEQSLSAKPADIIKSSNGLQMQRLAATGNLTDLTEVWDRAVKKGWIDDSIRPYYTYNGKVYALPMTGSNWVVFYNKKLFAKHGIEVPKTYADFEAAAAKLKSKGVTPIWSAGADGWTPFVPYQSLIGSVSPDFYTKLVNNEASFGDPESRQAMTMWQKWLKNKWTTPYDAKLEDAPSQMKAGKIAMLPIGTWIAQQLKGAGMEAGKDYGAFLMPPVAGTQQAVFFEGNGWAVPKRAARHDAAVKQIEAWLDPSVQKVWSDYLGDASPNITVPVSNPVIDGISKDIKASKARLLIRYFEAVPSPLVTNSTTIWGNFMLHPDELDGSVKELEDAAAKDWELWKKQNP